MIFLVYKITLLDTSYFHFTFQRHNTMFTPSVIDPDKCVMEL